MKYLKLVNCHVRGLFPEKGGELIDWEAAGFNPIDIARDQVNGFDSESGESHVTLYPISNESKLNSSGIINAVNTNKNPNDTAKIIDENEYFKLKEDIETVKQSMKNSNNN